MEAQESRAQSGGVPHASWITASLLTISALLTLPSHIAWVKIVVALCAAVCWVMVFVQRQRQGQA